MMTIFVQGAGYGFGAGVAALAYFVVYRFLFHHPSPTELQARRLLERL